MPSFWKHVNAVLREAQIIIEVLDARLIEETRNNEIEEKTQRLGKKLLFVVTKCDLVPKKVVEEKSRKLHPSVFISAKDKLGTTILKKKILELSRGENVVVGVVGYPNVGKSSLINALAGRHAARTSAESGFTRGMQKIRVDSKIQVLDTPGVFPNMEHDDIKHGIIGSVDYAKIKDPEAVALRLIEQHKELIEKHYNVQGEDAEKLLEALAVKYRKLAKGGLPDMDATGRMLVKDWQTGKIK